MDGERLDLSPLGGGPGLDREDRLVSAIMRRATPELTRRASRAGVLGVLGNWMWPALAAATVAALISGTVMARVQSDTDEGGGLLLGGLVPALGLAEPVSAWLDEGRAPQVWDVVMALEGDPR